MAPKLFTRRASLGLLPGALLAASPAASQQQGWDQAPGRRQEQGWEQPSGTITIELA